MIDFWRIYEKYLDIRWRLHAWWMWWSPPWRRTRLCPGCAGSKIVYNSYDERTCEVCNGAGRIRKYRL